MTGTVRRIPIRAKLAASLAVPLLGLLLFSALEVRQAATDAAQIRSETRLARAATGPTGIISRLQDERNWVALELTGLESTYQAPVVGYDETRGATDEAIRTFRVDVESKGGAVEATYREALESLDKLAEIRREVDDREGPRTVERNMPFATGIYDRYSELIHGLLDANSRITPQVRDAELRQGTELANLASKQIEVMADVSRQTVTDAMLSPNGIDTHPEIAAIAVLLAELERNDAQIQSATGHHAGIVGEHYPREVVEGLHRNVTAAIESGTVEDLDDFLEGSTPTPDGGYWPLRDGFFEAVDERAEALNADATARQRLFTGLATVVFLLAVAMTWLVSRSITRPLKSLTHQATDMAEHRLPDAVLDILETPLGDDVQVPEVEPIAVRTRDEVADVSEALNTVQDTALDLAVEQAVLRRNIADSFVNLGRRNQNLLGRQLDFITELESNETDPDTLASLFRLDHLATRMRRNAESLLVLAGIEPPRKWAAPVRITDVIRSALGEVEDYQRVTVQGVEPVTVVGSAAADLAHLLAELIENALTFSSPQASVVVRGWWNDRETYRLAIIDQGLGMPPSAVGEANRRLAGSESFTVAPSKYLGHYVAGNLATRHGVRIQLEAASASQGIVAVVDLPPRLLTGEPPNRGPGTAPRPTPPATTARPAGGRGETLAVPATAAAPAASPGPPAPTAPRGPTPPTRPVARPGPAAPGTATGRAGPTGHTASGLPRRTSAPPGPDRSRPAVPTGDLLDQLRNHADAMGRGPAPSQAPSQASSPAPARTEPGGQQPAPAAGGTTPSGLPRRVSGAQLPNAQVIRLQHATGQDDARQGSGRDGSPTPADDVYSFLSGFSAGVQRGLDESRRAGEES